MTNRTKIIWGAVAGIAFVILSLVVATISALTSPPDFTALRRSVEIPIVLANGNRSELTVGPTAPGWVPLASVSTHLVHAVIAQEDTSFFHHEGVDFRVERAVDGTVVGHDDAPDMIAPRGRGRRCPRR